MPKNKTTKKPKAKKVFYPCQYCNKGLKSIQGRIIHEKSCGLNPSNKEQKIESSEIAKTIPKETIKKMEEKLTPSQDIALRGIEAQQREATESGKELSPEEKKQFNEVLNFIQNQSETKNEIDSNLSKAEKIKSESKIVQATKQLQSLNPGQELSVQQALAISIIQNSQQQQQDAQQTRQLNNIYLQEKIKNLNEKPKESSELNDFLKPILTTLVQDMIKSKQENDIEKFSKTYELVKGLGSVVGEKSETGEIIESVVKSALPTLVDLGKEAMKKKQISQSQIPNSPVVENPNLIMSEKGQESLPVPVPESAPIISSNPGSNPGHSNPDDSLTDEEYHQKHKLEMDDYYDNNSSPLGSMYANFNKNSPVNKNTKMTE